MRKTSFEHKIEKLSEEYKTMQRFQFSQKEFFWFDDLIANSEIFNRNILSDNELLIVKNAIHYENEKLYFLHAYCLMPNHVHILVTPFGKNNNNKDTIAEITHTLKRYSARKINQLSNRKGSLWARESYDRIIRNEQELLRTTQYIINNPVKAGLVSKWEEWKYSWVAEDLIEIL